MAWHSEKLAVMFGLMSTEPGTSIQIVKNLRTCKDCHSALKAISLAYGRKTVVRDHSRIHTFIEGTVHARIFGSQQYQVGRKLAVKMTTS